ncbi:bridging integrator 3-like [Branchiostoma floridae]|uniref:Bridging integrator 3-like n=1 Tax=Branchiostoma floridae TaxID=7739 RepID=C3YIY0_BRAFL|nr:bridging integrator 3-like [Branchiostoma floridae]|eukprot:XP_002603843.1 hypothetical protein BRAFLDRAFT_285391 [Branchiostoma floridae]
MSWNPFNRLSASPKRTVISKTVEKDFERECTKLAQLDESTKKLYKDMRKCTEAVTALSKCEVKLGQDLVSTCQGEDMLRNEAEAVGATTAKLEGFSQELNTSSQKAVIEPMKRFTNIFPQANSAIRKREQSLQEYSRQQLKVEKLQEKERTGPNIVKLEQGKKALSAAKEDFEVQNSSLMEEMPQFYDGRIDYFQPCFEALLKSQVAYHSNVYKVLCELASDLGADTDPPPDHQYNADLQKQLSDMKALSIVLED